LISFQKSFCPSFLAIKQTVVRGTVTTKQEEWLAKCTVDNMGKWANSLNQDSDEEGFALSAHTQGKQSEIFSVGPVVPDASK
jgi:hypothetical protein